MSRLKTYNMITRKISQITLAFLVALIFTIAFSSENSSLIIDSFVPAVHAAGEDEEENTSFKVQEDSTESSKYKPDETGFVDYSGDVDIYTGKPVDDNDDNTRNSYYITIKDGSTYDAEHSMFIYTLENGTFSCSVCDGMVVTNPVLLEKEGEYNVALYRNGVKVDGIPATVTDPGSYVVITWDNESENQLMSFQIVEKETGRINQYIIPQGFTIKTVYLDGELQKNSFGSVDMTKEGYYEICYRCSATGIDYYLNVTTDHTPPDVTFEGIDSNSKAKGPVTLKGLQEGDTVYILLNSDETGKMNYQNQITKEGEYHVTVMDKAGNSISRDFIIMFYLNVKGVFFLSLIVVLIIGVLIALYISRKRLRVR